MKKWKLLERTNKYQMYSNPGQAKNNAINGKLIDLIPTSNFYGVIMKMLNGCSCGCRSWYQMVDGREATWQGC